MGVKMQTDGLRIDAIGKTWRAYLAGIIDGEGCIRVNKCKQRVGPNYSYEASLQVTMCDLAVIKKLQFLFGGSIRWRKPSSVKARPAFHWWVTGDRLRSLLNAAEPYLILKQPQALAALKVLNSTEVNHQGQRLTPEIIADRDACVAICTEFNRRGVNA